MPICLIYVARKEKNLHRNLPKCRSHPDQKISSIIFYLYHDALTAKYCNCKILRPDFKFLLSPPTKGYGNKTTLLDFFNSKLKLHKPVTFLLSLLLISIEVRSRLKGQCHEFIDFRFST